MEHHGAKNFDVDAIIIGAGAAGLFAAYRLQQANIRFLVLEAEDHSGGRVLSRQERHSHLGLTLDEGANLINSTDSLAIRLMDQFGITYVRRLKLMADSMNYVIGGTLYSQAEFDALIFAESRSAINVMLHDQEEWRQDETRDIQSRFIAQSIADYLTELRAGPVLQAALKSFFWSEYGQDLQDLNLHVLFDYLELDLTGPCFRLIPNVDEAYTVPSGMVQITNRMEAQVRPQVHYGHRVTHIDGINGNIRVLARNGNKIEKMFTAEHVFFAAPLHSLQKIKVDVPGLSPSTLDHARRATYARGSKLHLKFLEGFHRHFNFSGILLTDTGEQIWTSSTGQGGAGLLTVLTGPLPPGRATAVEHAGHVLKMLDLISPGLSEFYVGVERTDAPMSYSGALRPGEVAHLDIHEGSPQWSTIGEASSGELQGYLEGALRSADKATSQYILNRRARRRG